MPTIDMNLVLDENAASRRLRRLMRDRGGYLWKVWRDLGYQDGDGDKDSFMVRKANELESFVVTIDFRTITTDKFPPSKFPKNGILQFDENGVSGDYMFDRLEALQKLLLVDRAKGNFTYLYKDGIRIVTPKESIERWFADYDDLKDI